MILISVSTSSIFVYAIFLLPLPHLTEEQGEDLGIIGDYPIFIALGFVLLLGQMIFGLFQINQPPLIQELNLPEAQGTITSLGQLVEIASYGTGPLIAGYLLSTSNNNYLGVINSVIFFIFPGIIMWIIAYFTINKDIATVKGILGERASELKDNSK